MDNSGNAHGCNSMSLFRVAKLDKHSSFNGNNSDTYWYQFATNRTLKGLPKGIIEESIEKGIREALERLHNAIE